MMGKLELFEIRLFQHRYPYYLPGMWIEGAVQLRTKYSIKARAIRLKFNGQESAAWEEYVNNSTRSKAYKTAIELVNAYLTLWGYPKGSQKVARIEPGSYVFPFCIQVPAVDQLPPSCHFRNIFVKAGDFRSHVRYRLVAYIDRPMAADIEVLRPIRIMPRIPLTSSPKLCVPIELEDEVNVGTWCYSGGDIHVRVRCLRLGTLVGGTLKCTCEIVNDSKTDVVGVRMSLVRHASFYAGGHTKHHSNRIAKADYPLRVNSGGKFTNLNCSTHSSCAAKLSEKRRFSQSSIAGGTQPFSLTVPFNVSPGFTGRAISVKLELVFQIRLRNLFAKDIRMSFWPIVGTQRADVPVPSMCLRTVMNSSGSPLLGVLLPQASKGDHPVYFSFCGLDYDPEEQFAKDQQVSYPCFYDERWDTVPPSLLNFNTEVFKRLSQ